MVKICLVGNQNSGKTTLFNCLTGENQKIGNWPGVTVEKKTGIIKGTEFELVDLPGTYSLTPYTEEEKVTANYIINENPDLIVNIVDASCLERSLYLTTQLLEINKKVIVALNMVDVLEKKGIYINSANLSYELNTNVCRISALKQIGIEHLIKAINQTIIMHNCSNCKICSHYKKVKKYMPTEEDITSRYNKISKIVERCMSRKKQWVNATNILDKIFLNKIFAIPIFVLIMFSIYMLTVGVIGKYTSQIMTDLMTEFSKIVSLLMCNLKMENWIQSLIVDGILKGITAVLNFLPQLAMLYLCISVLESTGYMSRVAFILDGFFSKIGLSGKSIIPFIIGSGCSVPGVLSTKIIENKNQRHLTSILVPFIPCSAKLPIIAIFSSYYFKENAGLISFSFYILSIIIIISSSIFLKNKSEESAFVAELPDYRMPNIKYILKEVKEKIIEFVKRAGSTILLASAVIWFLLSFSTNLKYGTTIDKSILAVIGKKISWIFYPMIGVNSWEAAVSAVQGLIAKEQVISSMTIIFGSNSTFDCFNKFSAYAYVVFNLFSAPCIATISTMKRNLGGFLEMVFAICYQTTVAWILSTLIYQLSLLIF